MEASGSNSVGAMTLFQVLHPTLQELSKVPTTFRGWGVIYYTKVDDSSLDENPESLQVNPSRALSEYSVLWRGDENSPLPEAEDFTAKSRI